MEEKKIDKKPKIFSIRKIKRRKKKDFFNRKIIIKVNNGLKKKEIILQNSFNPNSLISISHEVKKFIKAKKTTTSNEVTNHIVNLLNSTNNMSMSFKNIQRRVYDAINVMASIGLVHKENNVITYLNVNKITKEKAKEQISTLKTEINNKQINLISKLSEINCYNRTLTEQNESMLEAYRTKFDLLTRELQQKSSEIEKLLSELKEKDDKIKYITVNNSMALRFSDTYQDEIEKQKFMIEKQKKQIHQVEKEINDLLISRKSEGDLLLENEHLKDDNVRLLQMLKSTNEYHDP